MKETHGSALGGWVGGGLAGPELLATCVHVDVVGEESGRGLS